MDEKLVRISTAVVSVVAAFMTLLGAFFWMKASTSLLWSQEAAGWSQAIGSVLAIGVAIELSRRQNISARKTMIESDVRQLKRRLDSYRGILNSASNLVQLISDDLRGVLMRQLNGEPASPAKPELDRMYMTMALNRMNNVNPFNDTIQTIDTIPLHELGSAELVEAYQDFKTGIRLFSSRVQHALDLGEDNYDDVSLWNSTTVWPSLIADFAKRFESEAKRLETSFHVQRPVV